MLVLEIKLLIIIHNIQNILLKEKMLSINNIRFVNK